MNVTKYKQTVLSITDIDDVLSTAFTGCFTQSVVDNIDPNIQIPDANNIFHRIRMIVVLPKLDKSESIQERCSQRSKQKLKVQDLILGKGVPIK